jgi:membrane-associated phospholipid phosphatase
MPRCTTGALALAATLALPLGAAPLALLAPRALPAQEAPAPADTSPRSNDPLFTRADLAVFGGFALATAAAVPLDVRVAKRLQDPHAQENRFFRRSAAVVTRLIEPGGVVVSGTLYAVGRLGGNERMATLGLRSAESLVLALGTTGLIKGFAGRARPYVPTDSGARAFGFGRGFAHEEYRSFPSGHTTAAFALAAALTSQSAEWCDDCVWYVAPALYGVATLAGLARMYDNKHWASDVIVGAGIGVFSGLKVVRYHATHGDTRIDQWLLSGSAQVGSGGVGRFRVLILPY